MRVAPLSLLACLIVAGCGGASKRIGETHRAPTRAAGPVLLGSKDFIVWGGIGFGSPHPAKLVVGSDPSVLITHIRWHDWGRSSAWGIGRYAAPHFGRGGSYYDKPFPAELRVSVIGRCQPNGPRTYMKLKVRVALEPGQSPGWYEADGSHGLCSYP
jgi:hypothetical protein